MKTIAVYLMVLITGIFFLTYNTGCANVVPPAGGPRDSLPPQLVEAEPADSTTNFRGNTIRLQFDEFVDLQDVSKNLLFTPIFNMNPEVSVRLRTITIRMRDTLEPNTTYIFNFGNAIKDINEGNILRNFTYTFSTGPVLDSFELSGKVLLAEDGRIDTTLIVMLHRNLEDSAVINDKPRYVTTLNREGNFRFTNLPAGTFAIYALGEAGTIRRYQNKKQLFAFADSPIVIGPQVPPVTLLAYREVPPSTPATSSFGSGRPQRGAPAAEKRLRYNSNLINNQQDLLKDLVLTFEPPLATFDSSRIRLTRDSSFNNVNYSTSIDSLKKTLTIRTTWQEGTVYNLVIAKEFATDTLGNSLLKTDTLTFTTRKRADYGNLVLRVRNLENIRNPVLQFVQNNKVVLSVPLPGGIYRNELFIPGDYDLRILEDENNNGQWDAGDFFNGRKQPEVALPLNRKINVKANWDNEIEVSF